jgi:peptide/nickel transport system substrate-binding protein
VNFADPWHEDDEMRSEPETEHPFLGNDAIREAINLSIQRDVIAEELYGPGFVPTRNNLAAPEWVQHPELNEWEWNLERAAELLDEAGVVDEDGDGVREYNGTPLDMLYTTSINSIRQKNQEIVQDDLNSIGFNVELKSVDAAVYFSSDPGNPDTLHHFYADIQMFTNLPSTTYPANWVRRFHTDEMKTKANNYAGDNVVRWSRPDLDEIIEQIATEMDPDEQQRLFQDVNWITGSENVEICIIHRGDVAAVANDLVGHHHGPWRSDVWNIGDWYRE